MRNAGLGIRELQRYLVDKIQEVYRSQSVAINDKHIEVICRQMLRSVRVTRVGDTDLLVDEQVDRFRFMEENDKVMNRGGEPADGTPLLLGITKHRSRRTASSPPPRSMRPQGFSPKPASPAESTTLEASRKRHRRKTHPRRQQKLQLRLQHSKTPRRSTCS